MQLSTCHQRGGEEPFLSGKFFRILDELILLLLYLLGVVIKQKHGLINSLCLLAGHSWDTPPCTPPVDIILEMSNRFLKSIIQGKREQSLHLLCARPWKKVIIEKNTSSLCPRWVPHEILDAGIWNCFGILPGNSPWGEGTKIKEEMVYLTLICALLKMSPIKSHSECLPVGLSPNSSWRRYSYMLNKEYQVTVMHDLDCMLQSRELVARKPNGIECFFIILSERNFAIK